MLGPGLVAAPASAADAVDEEDDSVDTVTGAPSATGRTSRGRESGQGVQVDNATLAKRAPRLQSTWAAAARHRLVASEWLSVPPEFVRECRQGRTRSSCGTTRARSHSSTRCPWSTAAGVSEASGRCWSAGAHARELRLQGESQYQTAHRSARMELEEALQIPGNDAWENFLLADFGIESIHLMRREEFVKALNRGYEAMKAVEKTQKLAPDFTDINLGDGLFNYWVSVVSQHTKLIPDMGDKRELGIQQLLLVERSAVFLQPPATLALTFTWIEEGKKEAPKSGLRNYRSTPTTSSTTRSWAGSTCTTACTRIRAHLQARDVRRPEEPAGPLLHRAPVPALGQAEEG